MKWLITGGAGFIGRNLISYLFRHEPRLHEILVLDNLCANTLGDMRDVAEIKDLEVVSQLEPAWDGRPDTVKVLVGDIRDASACLRAAKGADVVVHLAANTGVAPSVADPNADRETNVNGTMNCLEAARASGSVRRFVFASSGAPAGICEPPIREDMPAAPASPYGASKLAGEGYCSAYFHSFGVRTVALRFSNVYGPYSGRKGSVVASFLRRVMEGRPVDVYGDGSQTRDFIYVDDLVRAIHLAATREGLGGDVFQIATGQETSVNQLIDELGAVLAAAGLPRPDVVLNPPRTGDVPRNYADPSRARARLGWEAQTALRDGLKTTVAWFTAQRARASAPAE